MDYSFDAFWPEQLANLCKNQALAPLAGWDGEPARLESFVAANVAPRQEYDNLQERVWLIAAPGAVGKSTLAKEICASTGAVYLDLAEASTVAGNYLVGGLVYTQLLAPWAAGETAVVIDALDEARLRVTQAGFEDFLADVAKVAKMGKFPVILLGRVGIIEEAWLILNEGSKLSPPIFDISFFDTAQASQFVMAQLEVLSKSQVANTEYSHLKTALVNHRQVYDDAVAHVIQGISQLSQVDADRFVGYAPVLDAVAKVIASEPNPARIKEDLERILEGEVLTSLADQILERESGKLTAQLKNANPDFPEGLYGPDEQLHRLSCLLFNLPAPPVPSSLSASLMPIYEQAVKALLPQHPFLSGDGRRPSSSVFEAAIVSYALKSQSLALCNNAVHYVFSVAHTSNPFLIDFYLSLNEDGRVPAEHIGIIFDSVASKASGGDQVRLYVSDGVDGSIECEIIFHREDGKMNSYHLVSPGAGVITLARKVSGVSIDCEEKDVALGSGGQLELIAPTAIKCRKIKLNCDQLVVKSDPKKHGEVVVLEADVLDHGGAIAAPVVRAGVQFSVAWEGAESYPWSAFAILEDRNEPEHISEGLRTLRRLVMAFRSHSKGQLARFRDKIDHFRMLKGKVGEALLQKLIDDEIIWTEGAMYCLDANALGAKVGISFQDAQAKRYSQVTKKYVAALVY
ncbi:MULTISPECIES: hypothetical protein [unclassified Pseudomonas]|uniref:hypothetical protein n=1 Tax=unclassified Pseudomonas TaxID=196821 RepID=UPI000B7359CE|nr:MULTISPECIES: hypothetical protein [unclassified Pseudomonas]SNT00499.1 hypothetical protein SAMN05660216_02193 [Pseudomonas sp. LAMO17WK12:I8]SNY21872.1 hypothetical protein SAMN05660700_02196 [Pseudomonas sp. LAMO17WK12:I7]SNY23742.1 hypothetical protein SAMN05660344_02514 [Pseudomonas sp. LAMO17WK12:I11]SNY26551.1 hypothetical protein SAMN05660893_02887 [Pseudomonas sp. LAMO17WK12:I12]